MLLSANGPKSAGICLSQKHIQDFLLLSYLLLPLHLLAISNGGTKKKKKKLAQCADFVLRFSPAVSDLADKLRWLCVRTQSHLVLLQDCVLHAWSFYFQTELLLCAPKEAMEACCEECTFHLVTVACCFLFLISTREWSCVNAKCGSFWATYFYVYWLVLSSAAQCPEQTTYCVTFM